MDEKKEVAKKEPKKDIGITEAQLDAIAERLNAGERVTGNTDELFAAQAKALQQIAEQTMPTNIKKELARLDEEHESPYVEVKSKVAILIISTIDLARVDGWPGYIDEPIPGEFTAQGLQKRARMELIPHYEPGLDASYALQMMDRKEYEEMQSGGAGNISQATALSSQMLRATEGR